MRRLIAVLLLAVALVGAFLLGRHTAQPGVDTQRVEASGPMGVNSGPEAAEPPARMTPGDARPRAERAGTGAASASASLPVSSSRDTPSASGVQGTEPPPSSGPQPLRQDDAGKLAAAESRLAAEGGVWRDLLDLAAHEEQDEEARRLEQRIAQTILRHGARYTLLRLAPPRCTRSVCVMRGVGGGRGIDPRSDWQGLSRTIMNEPWFRESFDDMRSSMSIDGGETVYVTLFVRCDPGNCRLGSR